MGMSWLRKLRMDWADIFPGPLHSRQEPVIRHLGPDFSDWIAKYPHALGEVVTPIQGFVAQVHLKPGTVPVFQNYRIPPILMLQPMEDEIRRLESIRHLVHVLESDWATLLVCVSKPGNKVRICGDIV